MCPRPFALQTAHAEHEVQTPHTDYEVTNARLGANACSLSEPCHMSSIQLPCTISIRMCPLAVSSRPEALLSFGYDMRFRQGGEYAHVLLGAMYTCNWEAACHNLAGTSHKSTSHWIRSQWPPCLPFLAYGIVYVSMLFPCLIQ